MDKPASLAKYLELGVARAGRFLRQPRPVVRHAAPSYFPRKDASKQELQVQERSEHAAVRPTFADHAGLDLLGR